MKIEQRGLSWLRTVWVAPALGLTFLATAHPAFAQISLGSCSTTPIGITKPGSYILHHNLVAASGRDCINVKVSSVTIELNGFGIFGLHAGKIGINAGGQSDISVRNGTVTGMTGAGIILGKLGGGGGAVEGVHADGNGGDGIQCKGNKCVISGNSANNNGANGIEVDGSYGRISGNTANGNTANGIVANAEPPSGQSNIISGNTANGNLVEGILCGANSMVNGNTANANSGGNGIDCGTGSSINGNVASLNKGSGILTGDNVRIGGNVVNDNLGDGITAGTALAQGNEANADGGYGLNTSSVGTGYTENVFNGNSKGAVSSAGVSLGHNLCNGSPC